MYIIPYFGMFVPHHDVSNRELYKHQIVKRSPKKQVRQSDRR